MASFTFNLGSYSIAHRDIDYLNGTIKIMLLGTGYTPNANEASMTTPAASELSVSGYTPGFSSASRKTLIGKTISTDSTNHRTIFDADDPDSWTLGSGTTVVAAIVYWHNTSDALSIPLFYLDFTDTASNSGIFNITFPTTGIGFTQQ